MELPPARPPLFSAAQIPNLICILRMALVWPIVDTLLTGRYALALALVAVAGLSDGLDGYLAKRFDWRSRLGGLLDPLADKLLLVSTFLTLAYASLAPLWLAAVVVIRDVVIVSGGLIYQALVAPVRPEPSRASKLNTAAQLFFVCAVIANRGFGLPPAEVLIPSGAAVLVTSTVSGLDYVVRWSGRAIRAQRR
ncbi:MAG: CDP-alcohol phosphatidyltransferase family protein [Gammaproteobacteria bacterium]|nr:CDP-alcohol phosphatidyltransferase family protein [Gammaproteobacteria bacterium]MDH5275820.1 CDP-alcohol phosphatidyltransferase family protein [Gammaproteobacteria bacterium]